jgi:hypothetical protein
VATVKGRRLKVFQAQIGFYDTVVAAPSQAAALRAWGVHQNLFANGEARITDDAQAKAAAIAHPEVPLRRAVGSADPFALEPTSSPKGPVEPGKSPAKGSRKASSEASKRAQADRTALTAAEAALGRLDADHKKQEAMFRQRQDQLNAERDVARGSYIERRRVATGAVVAARNAYRKVGGAD